MSDSGFPEFSMEVFRRGTQYSYNYTQQTYSLELTSLAATAEKGGFLERRAQQLVTVLWPSVHVLYRGLYRVVSVQATGLIRTSPHGARTLSTFGWEVCYAEPGCE